MKLPGAEEWTPEAVSSRIAFERSVADASFSLLAETAASNNFVNPEELARQLPSDSIFALGRAAELAFGTENIELGLQICREILVHDQAAPRTPLQFAFYATIGALLRSFKVSCDFHGARILEIQDVKVDKFEGQFERRPYGIVWPNGSSSQSVKLIRLLLPAAAASGLSNEVVEALSNSEGERGMKPSVAASVFASPEYEAITSWQRPQTDFERLMGAMEALETNYHRRLGLLRSDIFYWRTMRPRGSIIDWSLLALWVFLFRFGNGHHASERIGASSEEASYIRSLARYIATHTSGGEPSLASER